MPGPNNQWEQRRLPVDFSSEGRRWAQSIHDVLDEIYAKYGRLSEKDFSVKFNERVDGVEGDYSEISQTVGGIESRVTGVEGDFSTINQTVGGIESRVTGVEGDFSTINQTVGGIESRVTGVEGDFSAISQTVGGIESRVTGVEGDFSAISQTVGGIESRVTGVEGDFSAISQTVGGIESRVTGVEGDFSAISQTVGGIETRVTGVEGDFSAINQTVGGIETRVTGVEGDFSAINQTVGGIGLEVSNIQVGGTNTYRNAMVYELYAPAASGTFGVIGRNADDYLNGFYLVGPSGGPHYLRFYGVITGNGLWTVSFEVKGTQNVAVYMSVSINDAEAQTFCTTDNNTYKKVSITADVTNWESSVYNFVDFRHFSWAYFKIKNIKIEKGNKATDWSPHPSEATGVKTSSVLVNQDGIYMDTTGTFSVNAGVAVSIKGGATTKSIGVANNETNEHFLWAGDANPASAPFRVKMDGSVYAKNLQQIYSQSFWDMSDNQISAEFWVYIPSGYTIDSVEFSTKVSPCRTFAKSAGTPSTTYTSIPDTDYTGGPSDWATPNSHYHGLNAHKHTLSSHTHPLDFGVTEAAGASINGIGTWIYINGTDWNPSGYYPNPPTIEIKNYVSAGWNSLKAWTNMPAKVSGFVTVKITSN